MLISVVGYALRYSFLSCCWRTNSAVGIVLLANHFCRWNCDDGKKCLTMEFSCWKVIVAAAAVIIIHFLNTETVIVKNGPRPIVFTYSSFKPNSPLNASGWINRILLSQILLRKPTSRKCTKSMKWKWNDKFRPVVQFSSIENQGKWVQKKQ